MDTIQELLVGMGCLREQRDGLCRDCEAVQTVYEVEEYWGMRTCRAVPECPADFVPGEPDCARLDEHQALTQQLEELSDELDQACWVKRRQEMLTLCDDALERLSRAVEEIHLLLEDETER